MSSQEQTPSIRTAPSPRANPSCPNCRRLMTVRQVGPLLFASDVDEIVYGCEECGTETKRTVRRG